MLSARCVFEVRSISEYYILHVTRDEHSRSVHFIITEHVKGLNAADARPTWRSPPCRAARVGEYRQYRETTERRRSPRTRGVRAGLLNRVAGTRHDKDIGAGALPGCRSLPSAATSGCPQAAEQRCDRASSYTYVVSKCSVLRLRGMGAT